MSSCDRFAFYNSRLKAPPYKQAKLLQLAIAVPDSIPKLRRLKIDIDDNCQPEQRYVLEQMRSVEANFANVAVQVECGAERGYSISVPANGPSAPPCRLLLTH